MKEIELGSASSTSSRMPPQAPRAAKMTSFGLAVFAGQVSIDCFFVLAKGIWYRAYGNENWDFAENGLMCRRQAHENQEPSLHTESTCHHPKSRSQASINDVQIKESARVLTRGCCGKVWYVVDDFRTYRSEDRRFTWPELGHRPEDFPSLSELYEVHGQCHSTAAFGNCLHDHLATDTALSEVPYQLRSQSARGKFSTCMIHYWMCSRH